MSEADILKAAVGVLCTIGTTIGGALVWLVVQNAKQIMKSIAELRDDVRGFDKRITILEVQQQSGMRVYSRGAQGHGAD
jgi:hypothetical protein